MKKKFNLIYAAVAAIAIVSCGPPQLTKIFYNGEFNVEFTDLDTNIIFGYNAIISLQYDQLGEGTHIYFYAEQEDSNDFYKLDAHFWNSGVYEPNREYIEGEYNTGNYAHIYPMMGDTLEGSYNFDEQILIFEQVDENRVKGKYYGTYQHGSWMDHVPVTVNFDFTP